MDRLRSLISNQDINIILTLIIAAATALNVLLNYRSIKRQDNNRKEQISGVKEAIRHEVSTIWEIYMAQYGEQLEQLGDNKKFEIYFPVSQDYFTIYKSNASLIGQLSEAERRLIVTSYSEGQGIIDSIRRNNDLLDRYNELSGESPTKTNIEGILVEHAKYMKKRHDKLKQRIKELDEHLKLGAKPN